MVLEVFRGQQRQAASKALSRDKERNVRGVLARNELDKVNDIHLGILPAGYVKTCAFRKAVTVLILPELTVRKDAERNEKMSDKRKR